MCDDNEKKRTCFYYNIDSTLGKPNEQTTPKTKKKIIICSWSFICTGVYNDDILVGPLSASTNIR